MRIVYKQTIRQKIVYANDKAKEGNRQIFTIYLNSDEWDEFRKVHITGTSFDGVEIRPDWEQEF